ncbi:MAG: argininosuccinate synthase [Alphaproteobacteria bacterium]|nr:argininosuccinate synthase [Alphaproteobacteria bacterium]
MNVQDLKGQTIAFAASGGLDSCTITHWLTSQGVKVVAMTADLAQPDESDFSAVEKRMRASGAVDYVAVNLHKQIAQAGIDVMQAQASYEGRYWNTTGIARHVTVSGLLPEVKKRGIKIWSHGATGRGNDQVRFQLITNMLMPEMEVYAPWRDQAFLDRFGGRQQMITYCEQHGIPITATRDKPYSTDANLLGLTHEGGQLESLMTGAHLVAPGMGVWPEQATDKAEQVTLRFEAGVPVAINGKPVDVFAAVSQANQIGGRHGIGIGLHLVENRFVGVKSRGVYEAPGMELLCTSFAFLLQLVADRRTRELYDQMSLTIGKQIYQGYWNDVCTSMARAAIAPLVKLITGTVTVSLYRGGITFVSAQDAPASLFSNDGSMEQEGSFDHKDSEGFLRVLAVNARALARTGQVKRL